MMTRLCAAAILLATLGVPAHAQPPSTGNGPRVLIVVAHPDDEYCFAATVFRIARELGGTVDQIVITNGEAGYKYSFPAEFIYGKKLATEAIGRQELPAIRQQELLRSGKILGVNDHVFLDQKDFDYTLDAADTLSRWDRKAIDETLLSRLRKGKYDAVFTLLPTNSTHGHHKAAAILALDAVSKLDLRERPIVLGCANEPLKPLDPSSEDGKGVQEARQFTVLPGYPETRVFAVSLPPFDRNAPLGYLNRLSYHIYVNWMIAEHKSQGLFQTYYNKDDLEIFHVFDTGNARIAARAREFMSRILPTAQK